MVGAAQNLVPNPSFEEFSECPDDLGQVDRATGWTIFSQSPDYFNRCNTNDTVDVPFNAVGYQEAFDGDAYMGVGTYVEGNPTYREVIECELASPLVSGVPVYIALRASTGGFGNEPDINSLMYASNGLGVKFSVTHQTAYVVWPGNVALQLNTILSDTSNWIQISGSYVPDSAYEYVLIGCFLPYDEIEHTVLQADAVTHGAYAFVDEVCVSTEPADCPLSIGIREIPLPLWNRGENPVRGDLHLGLDPTKMKNASLSIVDGEGRVCLRLSIPDNATEVHCSLSGLADGSYFVRLDASSGSYRPIHVVHVSP
jgi:hypothetical protein